MFSFLGLTLKSVVRIALYFALFLLVIWGLNITLFILQLKGLIMTLICEFCEGGFFTFLKVVDWIITCAISAAVCGGVTWCVIRVVDGFFFGWTEFGVTDIVTYIVTALIVMIICNPDLKDFFVPDSIMTYVDFLNEQAGYRLVTWEMMDPTSLSVYLGLGVVGGSIFGLRDI